MNEHPLHCPFLNQSDSRCSEQRDLNHLSHAYHYCFGAYQTCPVYVELLSARLSRRMKAAHAHATASIPARETSIAA
jgi:hypothetical protein